MNNEKRRSVTLVEIIIGITILALIGTISFSKFDLSNYKINSFMRQLASDMRYVRKMNKIGNNSVYIVLEKGNGKNGYVLRENGQIAKTVYLPKNIGLECSQSKLSFNGSGYFNGGGTTISIIKKQGFIQMTVVPVSGRVLIKEGIYK